MGSSREHFDIGRGREYDGPVDPVAGKPGVGGEADFAGPGVAGAGVRAAEERMHGGGRQCAAGFFRLVP